MPVKKASSERVPTGSTGFHRNPMDSNRLEPNRTGCCENDGFTEATGGAGYGLSVSQPGDPRRGRSAEAQTGALCSMCIETITLRELAYELPSSCSPPQQKKILRPWSSIFCPKPAPGPIGYFCSSSTINDRLRSSNYYRPCVNSYSVPLPVPLYSPE